MYGRRPRRGYGYLVNPQNERVWKMYKEGKSRLEIIAETGLKRGQVYGAIWRREQAEKYANSR